MRFFVRKRRHTPSIIIVALIDVLIVLLIFLMVTTTFKQQAALRLALPESSQAHKSGSTEEPPLVISIDPQGLLRVGPDGRPVTVDQLRAEIATQLAKNPDLKLAISADKAAPWGQVVKIMDVAKEAKVKDKMINAFIKEIPKAE